MKKLLVLSLVLGIASLASAGFDLAQTSPSTANVIGAGDNAVNAGGGVFLGIAGGTVDVSDLTGWALSSVNDVTDTIDAGTKGFIESLMGEASSQIWQTNFADSTPGFDLDAQDLASIVLATGSSVKVYAFDGATAEPAGMVTLVPEPATMALLGLGALVLRRKK